MQRIVIIWTDNDRNLSSSKRTISPKLSEFFIPRKKMRKKSMREFVNFVCYVLRGKQQKPHSSLFWGFFLLHLHLYQKKMKTQNNILLKAFFVSFILMPSRKKYIFYSFSPNTKNTKIIYHNCFDINYVSFQSKLFTFSSSSCLAVYHQINFLDVSKIFFRLYIW